MDADLCELVSVRKYPVRSESTGKSRDFGQNAGFSDTECPKFLNFSEQIPCSLEQGKLETLQGIERQLQGILRSNRKPRLYRLSANFDPAIDLVENSRGDKLHNLKSEFANLKSCDHHQSEASIQVGMHPSLLD